MKLYRAFSAAAALTLASCASPSHYSVSGPPPELEPFSGPPEAVLQALGTSPETEVFRHRYLAEIALAQNRFSDAITEIRSTLQSDLSPGLKTELTQLWYAVSIRAAGKDLDVGKLKQAYLDFWGEDLDELRFAEGVSATSFLDQDEREGFLKAWYPRFIRPGIATDPVSMAKALATLPYLPEFEAPFSGRDRLLFAGYSAMLRRSHKTALHNLDKYLAEADFKSDRVKDLAALEARVNTYDGLRKQSYYEKKLCEDLQRYISILKAGVSRRSDDYSERESIADLELRLAYFYVNQNRLEAAHRLFQDVLSSLQDDFSEKGREARYSALVRLAREELVRQGKFNDALETLERAEKETALDQGMLAYVKFYRAFYLYLQNRPQEALEVFDRGFNLFQRRDFRFRTAYWRARTLEKLGSRAQALAGYQKIATEAPLDYYGHLARQRIQGDPAAAQIPPLHAVTPWSVEFWPPRSWVAGGSQGKKPKLLIRAERLLDLRLLDLAQSALEEAVQKYPPSPEETGYALYFASLLSRARSYMSAFILLGPIFPREDLTEESPSAGLYYPRPHGDLFRKFSRPPDLETETLLGLARQESAFEDKIVSASFGYGLLQIQAETGEEIAAELNVPSFSKEMLLEPETGIQFAAHYLGEELHFYRGNLAYAVAAYNAGRPSVDSWIRNRQYQDLEEFVEDIPYDGTNQHVKNVLRNRANYTILYSGQAPEHYFSAP